MSISEYLKQNQASITSQERLELLDATAAFLVDRINQNKPTVLAYICTHNSRRSQFSQAWSAYFSDLYGFDFQNESAGVEVTACNERTIAALKKAGFQIETDNTKDNPHYKVNWGSKAHVELYSKTFDNPRFPKDNVLALMTCGHADENCPFIPGTLKRIPLRYEDPKAYDDTDIETSKYEERSLQIAGELNYLFQQIQTYLNR